MATFYSATGGSGGTSSGTADIIKVGGVTVPVQHTAFGIATPLVPIAGKYLATPVTYDDGDATPLLMDSLGRLVTSAVSGYAEDTVHVSGDIGTEMLTKRTDTAASSASADGDYATANTDSLGHLWAREGYAPVAEDNTNGVVGSVNKPLTVSTYSFSLFTNLGANATLNVKATAGNVFSVKCHNLNVADRYLQLHNTATVPAGAAVPLMTALIPAGQERSLGTDFFGQNGLNFTTGIAFAFSTTEGTYTAGTAGDQFTQVNYK